MFGSCDELHFRMFENTVQSHPTMSNALLKIFIPICRGYFLHQFYFTPKNWRFYTNFLTQIFLFYKIFLHQYFLNLFFHSNIFAFFTKKNLHQYFIFYTNFFLFYNYFFAEIFLLFYTNNFDFLPQFCLQYFFVLHHNFCSILHYFFYTKNVAFSSKF